MFDYILFDLDGTLTDPGEGITNSVAYSLEKMSIKSPPKEQLYKFIGPPLLDSYKKFFGMSDEESIKALGYYREYFVPKGMYENKVYQRIPELLEYLCSLNKKLILATSKPEPFAIEILKHFDLYRYFSFVAGSTLDEKRTAKEEVIKYIVDCLELPSEKTVMVGDRENDVNGAHINKIKCIGVLYGHGDKKELVNAGADFLAESPEKIIKYI